MRQRNGNGRVRQQSSASEELYRLIAEHSTDMISKHTPEGVYTYASPACRSLLDSSEMQRGTQLAFRTRLGEGTSWVEMPLVGGGDTE